MKTIHEIKKALDYDTMINEVYAYRREKAVAQQKAQNQARQRKNKNKWIELFPACK